MLSSHHNRIAGLILLALIASGSFWLWLKSRERQSGTEEPVALIAAIRNDPRTFNRYFGQSDASLDLLTTLIHGKLIRVNRQSDELEPWLAERWTSSEDGLSWTLSLRKDVTFSDGTQFTSADVLFAAEAVLAPESASAIAESLKVGGKALQFTAPDPFTVVVKFPSSSGMGLRVLDDLPILPRHKLIAAFQAGTFSKAWSLATPATEIVGVGPFVLSSYVPGQRFVLKRNGRYWRRNSSNAQLPYLDELVLRVVPHADAESLQIQSGALDIMFDGVRPEDLRIFTELAAKGQLQLLDAGVALDYDMMWFNLSPQPTVSRRWLQAEEFRKAISEAIDRQAMLNTVLLGRGQEVYGPVSPANHKWYSPVRRYAYNPPQAKSRFATLGLADRNGDGMLEDSQGNQVRFSVTTVPTSTTRRRSLSVLQEQLRKVGIAVDIVDVDLGQFIHLYNKRSYDAMYFNIQPSSTDPARNPDFWLSSGPFHLWHPNQSQPATDWERDIDKLFHDLASSVEPRLRKQMFTQIQTLMSEHVPVVSFVAPTVTVAVSARLDNLKPAPLKPMILWNADEIKVR
jgi:peptide/nickel transport system substrate-binding protein